MHKRHLLLIYVRPLGVEPRTPCFEGKCSIQLSYGRKAILLLTKNVSIAKLGAEGGSQNEFK